MKKAFIISFCFFYLITVSGFSLHLHYCGNKVKSISLSHSDSEESNCCGKMEKKGCCDEKEAFVKVEDSQFSASTLQIPAVKSVDICQVLPIKMAPITQRTVSSDSLIESPPIPTDPVYLSKRVLLI